MLDRTSVKRMPLRERLSSTPAAVAKSFVAVAVAVGLAGTVSGCIDSPTAPTAYRHSTAQQTWVAVTMPRGMPGLNSWLALRPAGESGRAVVEHARDLRRQAAELRRAGDMPAAVAREEAAVRVAIDGVERMPGPVFFVDALSAMAQWRERAEAELGDGDLPQLRRSVREVIAAGGVTRAALAAGDTLAAVHSIADAGAAMERQAPVVVALRAISDAEARLARNAAQGQSAARARHLLASTREALLERQGGRAMRQALYAMQLLEAAEADSLSPPPAP